MPFIATDQNSSLAGSAYVSSVNAVQETPFRHYFESDAIRSTLNDIRVASVTYPLRRPCTASFIPGIGEFLVDGFSPAFVGRGTTPEDAREDWQLEVHASFQELLNKRSFEMSSEDARLWSVLSSQIDVTVFRNTTPIAVRQFGHVTQLGRGTQAHSYPQKIKWEDGKHESISIDQVDSPDFITYKLGQPFEAIVSRDPVNFRLLRVVHIERRSMPNRLRRAEEEALLDSIGSGDKLPDAGWD